MRTITHQRTALEQLLYASIQMAKQAKLIAAQRAYISLLQTKLADRAQFDISADSAPAFLRRQAE